jgi:hypothetical protein
MGEPALNLAPNGWAAGGPRAQLFLEFCDEHGIVLEDAQAVAAAIAFDGVQPKDMSGRSRELARKIFGDVDVVTDEQRRAFFMVAGARSGKSYIFGAIRLLHLALTVNVSKLAEGEEAGAPIIAPTLKKAQKALQYIRGLIRKSPALQAIAEGWHKGTRSQTITLRRERDVVIAAVAASSGGLGARGDSLVGCLLDEAAFFRDESHAVNDREIYNAAEPRIVAGGQLLVITTPWAKTGLVYEFFRDYWGAANDNALVAHAPTEVMRTDPTILAQVAKSRAREPENAEREWDAKFVAISNAQFFDEDTLQRAFDDELELRSAPAAPGTELSAGGDFAFERNSSTLAILHRRGGVWYLAQLLEELPTDGAPLVPSSVTARFGAEVQRHANGRRGIVVYADKHYFQAVVEGFKGCGLAVADVPNDKALMYTRLRALMREGKLRIPNHPRLLKQLRSIAARCESGGATRIVVPRSSDGSHGDLVSALVHAAWPIAGVTSSGAAPTTPQSQDDERQARILRDHRRQAAKDRRRAG